MTTMEPIERSDTLSDKAYERLREALMSGTYKPGDALSIRGLADTLGISATPARDAISRLLWERGLQSGPFRTVLVPKLTKESLGDAYEVRLSLEGLAASLAAPRYTDTDVAELEAIHKGHVKAVNGRNYRAALAANESFHFHIYERANNELLLEIIRGVWLKLGPSLNLLYPKYVQTRQGVTHHEEIVSAMRKRNAGLARKAVEADLRTGLQELVLALHEESGL